MKEYKVCSFFGHRKIEITEELKQKLKEIVEDLIINHNVLTFLFGSRSDFDYLCHLVVTELKEKYPFILRASSAPEIDENFEFGKECARLGIIASPAHTGATFEIIEKAKDNGYSLMTHLSCQNKGES